MKSSIKKTLEIIKTGDYEEAKNMYNSTSSIIDRASQRGAIHKNKASREKSKLAKRLSKLNKDKNK
jgi:small subunit ribosomal protein S20